jgi:hypothetical protein
VQHELSVRGDVVVSSIAQRHELDQAVIERHAFAQRRDDHAGDERDVVRMVRANGELVWREAREKHWELGCSDSWVLIVRKSVLVRALEEPTRRRQDLPCDDAERGTVVGHRKTGVLGPGGAPLGR